MLTTRDALFASRHSHPHRTASADVCFSCLFHMETRGLDEISRDHGLSLRQEGISNDDDRETRLDYQNYDAA
jgi:hypothetical protein